MEHGERLSVRPPQRQTRQVRVIQSWGWGQIEIHVIQWSQDFTGEPMMSVGIAGGGAVFYLLASQLLYLFNRQLDLIPIKI